MRPQLFINASNWLQSNNPLYENITIDITNIDRRFTTLQHCEESSDSNTSEETESNTASFSNVATEDSLELTNDPLL